MDGLINFTNKYHNTVYSDKKNPLKLFTFPVGDRLDAAIRTKNGLINTEEGSYFFNISQKIHKQIIGNKILSDTVKNIQI